MSDLLLIFVIILWCLHYLRHHFPLIITYKLHDPSAKKPSKAYHKSACFDVYSTADLTIPPFGWKSIPFGVSFASWPHIYIPFLHITFTPFGNIAGRILTRSGLAIKKGVRVHLGIMDNDYREEWTAIVFNRKDFPLRVHKGDKIAQIEFYRVPTTLMIRVNKLSSSQRGTKGWGSTGM
jgi:dUTP pyrophosphatase